MIIGKAYDSDMLLNIILFWTLFIVFVKFKNIRIILSYRMKEKDPASEMYYLIFKWQWKNNPLFNLYILK